MLLCISYFGVTAQLVSAKIIINILSFLVKLKNQKYLVDVCTPLKFLYNCHMIWLQDHETTLDLSKKNTFLISFN